MIEPAAKLSISIPSELANAVRKRVGLRGLSRFIATAITHELEREQMGAFLADLETTHGPVPDAALEVARRELAGTIQHGGGSSGQTERMTFFQWVKTVGQAEIVRQLGKPFESVRVHRAAKAKHKVDEELVARCEAVLGDRFDRDGTIIEWYRLRKEGYGPRTAKGGKTPKRPRSTAKR